MTDIEDIGCIRGELLCLVEVGDLVHAAQGTEVVFVIVDLDVGAIEAEGGREAGA